MRDGSNPSSVYGNATDVATPNFAYRMSSSFNFSLNSSYPSTQGYSFYSAFVESSGSQLTLDLHMDGFTQPFVQTLLLNNSPFVAPGSVSSFHSTGPGQTATKTSSASSYTSSWGILSLVCGLSVLSMVS